jgi:hypothetical protein
MQVLREKETPFHGIGRESRAGGTTIQGQDARLHVTRALILFTLLFCDPCSIYILFYFCRS